MTIPEYDECTCGHRGPHSKCDEKKFFLTKIVINILSEEDLVFDSLKDVAHEVVDGDLLGTWDVKKTKVLTGKQAAKLACEMGSEPGWLGIDKDGKPSQ
jgi:hypothetical protein